MSMAAVLPSLIRLMQPNNAKDRSCPGCNQALPRSFWREMNRFWTGVQSAPCPHCNQTLEFEPDYGARLQICGEIFRYSVLTIVLLIVVRVATDLYEAQLDYVLLAAAIAALGSVFGSVTRTPGIRVQRSDDA